MSKYKVIQSVLTNKESLINALNALGVDFNQDSYFRGFNVGKVLEGDSVIVRKWTQTPAGPTSYSDLAWEFMPDGSVNIHQDADEDSGHEDLIGLVNQQVALTSLKDLAWANGFDLQIQDDGETQRIFLGGVSS